MEDFTLSDEHRELLTAAIVSSLGDTLVCTRVWEAWNYGTMTDSDFDLAREDDGAIGNIIEALLPVLAAMFTRKPEGETEPEDHAVNCSALHIDETAVVNLDWPDRCDCALVKLRRLRIESQAPNRLTREANAAAVAAMVERDALQAKIKAALAYMDGNEYPTQDHDDWVHSTPVRAALAEDATE